MGFIKIALGASNKVAESIENGEQYEFDNAMKSFENSCEILKNNLHEIESMMILDLRSSYEKLEKNRSSVDLNVKPIEQEKLKPDDRLSVNRVQVNSILSEMTVGTYASGGEDSVVSQLGRASKLASSVNAHNALYKPSSVERPGIADWISRFMGRFGDLIRDLSWDVDNHAKGLELAIEYLFAIDKENAELNWKSVRDRIQAAGPFDPWNRKRPGLSKAEE